MQRLTWRVVRLPQNRGFAGEVTFPDRLGHAHTVRSEGSTKVAAIKKASSLANTLVNDPTVKALLPPGAGAALSAVSRIASSDLAKKGFRALRKLW
jgi:hypothetical protein